MGGYSSANIGGHDVKYGDICEIEVFDDREWRWLSVIFIEKSDDGDLWFRCMNEGDSVRGRDTFPDCYMEVGESRFVRERDDVAFDLGSGI